MVAIIFTFNFLSFFVARLSCLICSRTATDTAQLCPLNCLSIPRFMKNEGSSGYVPVVLFLTIVAELPRGTFLMFFSLAIYKNPSLPCLSYLVFSFVYSFFTK